MSRNQSVKTSNLILLPDFVGVPKPSDEPRVHRVCRVAIFFSRDDVSSDRRRQNDLECRADSNLALEADYAAVKLYRAERLS